jgi:hypothetical protein
MPTLLSNVRCWVNSGKHLLALSISEFDPERTSTASKHIVLMPSFSDKNIAL